MPNTKNLPRPLLESYEWQQEGRCRGVDAEWFFEPPAERGTKKRRREATAKAVCEKCPVIAACRAHALSADEPYGVWGGLTPAERQQLKAQLAS